MPNGAESRRLIFRALPHLRDAAGWRYEHVCSEQETSKMRTMAIIIAVILLATPAAAQQTTFRDASGRITGTVTTDSNGQKTFRDGSGRMTGTANTDSNGTTTFRDASGRMTGTATSPRR
jgi:YD repeat-containing protein